MKTLLLWAIRVYQRHVSPYKGFRCAYRAHTGRAGCSALGYRAVRRHGALAGLVVLRRRLHRCGVAHRRYSVPPPRPLRHQRGDCDLPCDGPCDLPCDGSCGPDGKRGLSFCDLLNCCDCGSCDIPGRKRKAAQRDQDIHIPPPRRGRASGRA